MPPSPPRITRTAGPFMFGGVVETLIYVLVAVLLIALIVGIVRR